MEKIIISNVLKTFYTGLFFILCFINGNFCAQAKDSAANIPKATIALKDGATVFSSDNAFNGQISSNKIIREKADIAYQNNKNGAKNIEMTTPKEGSGTVTKNNEPKKESDKKKGKDKSSDKKDKKKISKIIMINYIHYC